MSNPLPHNPKELLKLPLVQKILNDKVLLFACLGAAGGCVGSIIGELPLDITTRIADASRLASVLSSAAFVAVAAAGIAIALFWAEELHRHSQKSLLPILLRALPVGAIAGAIGGGMAELIYGTMPDGAFREFIIRPLCWGVMGGLVGFWLSRSIPNLGYSRGLLGGMIGGVAGGTGFLLFASLIHAVLFARFLGMGLLGAALGLAIALVEKMFREASLEIIWTPGQTSIMTIGENPISIGGGDDHIRIKGLKPHAASVVLQDGNVQYIDIKTGKRTSLKNGSKLKVGTVQLVIHAKI